MLLASDLRSYTSDQQFAPFVRHAKELRNAFALETLYTDLATAHRLLASGLMRFDIVGLKFSFLSAPGEVLKAVRCFTALKGQGKLLYFDGDDDVCVQFGEVLNYCDLYVKKHAFADRSQYAVPTVGKSNLTDYVHHRFGTSFDADPIPNGAGVATRHSAKIRVLTNIAEDDKIWTLLARHATFPDRPRPYDVVYRATVNPDSWIFPLRDGAKSKLENLPERYRVLLPTARVDQDQYYEEMLSSKLCLSPFGYGEICWRDFEAILCGAVLLKPDMSHVETRPNVFEASKTYIPVAWDFSDLQDVCQHYLNEPARCVEIARAAHERLTTFLRSGGFVRQFGAILSELGLVSRPPSADVT